jgi:hypothetical protein
MPPDWPAAASGEFAMPQPEPAANGNTLGSVHRLTEADRALLRVVTGWPAPGEAMLPLMTAADGKALLFPPLAAVILDARRSGALRGELTPATFLSVAAPLSKAHSPKLRLSRAQIGAGFRHLAIETMGFTAGRAGATAG